DVSISFFFQAEDGIRDRNVTGVQTCALPILKTIKGPAVFLAQFVDNKAPFNTLEGMCKWAADLGYKGIQIPTWESFLIDLDKARSEERRVGEDSKAMGERSRRAEIRARLDAR